MKRCISLFLCFCLWLGLVSCSPAPGGASSSAPEPDSSVSQPEQTPFRLAIYPDYSLHPVLAENRANLTLAGLLYEPLFLLDEHFEPQNVLCQSWTASPDYSVWNFSVRPDVTFSDGTPLTGQIVADALNLARGAGSRYQTRLQQVRAVTAAGQTVTVTLSQPNAALPALLDIPISLGAEERPLGTGPYAIVHTGDGLSLRLRDNWWQSRTQAVPEIPLLQVSSSDALLSAFSSGDVGLVDVDLMGTNSLGYSGSYEVWDYATTDLIYLGFNTQSGPLRSAAARKAAALAVDRASAAQVDYARHAVATVLPFHPASSLYDSACAEQAVYDPVLLTQSLEQLSLSSRALVMLVNSENSTKLSIAQRIAGQLQDAGLQIQLKKLPFEDYVRALERGEFDLYLGEVVLTADFDLSPLLSYGGALNYGRWYSETCASLLYRLRTCREQERVQAAGQLSQLLLQEMPIVPICFKNGSVLTQWDRIGQLTPVRGNVFYTPAE